jgi:serine/threonine protein kinase
VSPHDYDVRYAAPEVLHAQQQNQQLSAHPAQDMWTLGVIAYELVTGERVFADAQDMELLYKCANALAVYPFSGHTLHPDFKKSEARACIEGCTRRDPMSRLTAAQAVSKLRRLGNHHVMKGTHGTDAADMLVRP